MRTTCFAALAISGAGLLTACSDADPTPIERLSHGGAAVVHVEGGALTLPSTDAPGHVVRDLVHRRGKLVDLDVTADSGLRDGIRHVRMEQRVGGLRVHDSYVRAALDADGQVVHLIERVFPAGTPSAATIDGPAAIAAAKRNLGYEATRHFYRAPSAEAVAYADELGALHTGFVVETWTAKDNLLDYTLVGGDGKIVSVERRTNNETYRVFSEDPAKSAQEDIEGAGWLGTAMQKTTNISGPNVIAYLDRDNNNAVDAGGVTVSDGNFLATANFAQEPTVANNQAVAVQNLFYLNNVLHDVLEGAGFTNAEGNFEGNDPVRAEAQDGGAVDNANMSTPIDGSSPRMQMYLWTSALSDAYVVHNGVTASAYAAEFGPKPTVTGLSAQLAIYNGKRAPKSDGCSMAATSLSGKIAIVDRGTCDFTEKVLNAQRAGAVGVIVVNNVASEASFIMAGTSTSVTIPSVMVTLAQGTTLKSALGVATISRDTRAVQIDASLDSDIVNHEYGHGLTWRMIGSMSGPLSGAIGEGASDVLAFLLNGDDAIGEYSASYAGGIRRSPYSTATYTYLDVLGTYPHDDGEVYAAAMWKVLEGYRAIAGLADPQAALLTDFVQGMRFTAPAPAFEDMRDGMLAIPNLDAARRCAIWKGFAAKGIGAGANGEITRRGKVVITASTTIPPNVCP